MSDWSWHRVAVEPPSGDLLVWAKGRPRIAVALHGVDNGKRWRDFMDPASDELLSGVSHWAELPPPPE